MVELADAFANAGFVLLGFALAIGWDRFKESRHTKQEKTRLAAAIYEEVVENAGKADAMRRALRTVLSQPENLYAEPTLSPLSGDSWRLALFNWPLLNLSKDMRSVASGVYALGEHINQIIRIREGFIIGQNPGVVRRYDTMLLSFLDQYVDDSGKVGPLLGPRQNM